MVRPSCGPLEGGYGGWLGEGECGGLAVEMKVICPYMQTQLKDKSLPVYPTNQHKIHGAAEIKSRLLSLKSLEKETRETVTVHGWIALCTKA